MTTQNIAIGADIGGSHITCRLIDPEHKTIVGDIIVRRHVDSQASKDEILSAWCEAIVELKGDMKWDNIKGIGFAMPGPFDYPNGIGQFEGVPKFHSLNGVNVRNEIIRRLGLPDGFPVRFMNDAACFAIGESFFGQVSAHNRFLAITLGTGFGTTFIKEHRPVAGEDGLTEDGFLWYVKLGDGMADDHFSTRWFVNTYKNLTGIDVPGVKELSDKYASEPIIQQMFSEFGNNLGSFLAPWLKAFGAEAVVIGGNISGAYAFFKEDLDNSLLDGGANVRIYISELQENAALCGSAVLSDNDFYHLLIK
ncbi:MAG: ROK family protein [Saprospiraceae bacterium]|jgi:glucokinase|nr:ROK family protein [Saprospiraceae bacterium]